MRVAVVVPVHCEPDIARLTLGTFFREHAAHELIVHVGIHSNWTDYCKDTSLFQELRGRAAVHSVGEIDWYDPGNERWWRYSTMHAVNVLNLLRHAVADEWDRLLVLDQDMVLRGDLVGLLAAPGCDMAATLLDDCAGPVEFTTAAQGAERRYVRLPKPSAWHMLLSRRLVEAVLQDETLIMPGIGHPALLLGNELPIFCDTFARLLHACRGGLGSVAVLSTAKVAEVAEHLWCSSFNYGLWTHGPAVHAARTTAARERYRAMFPAGWPPPR